MPLRAAGSAGTGVACWGVSFGSTSRTLANSDRRNGFAEAAVGALADLYHVAAVGRHHDRGDGVLAQERRVVRGGQLEALHVEDGDVGIEHRLAQAHTLDLR